MFLAFLLFLGFHPAWAQVQPSLSSAASQLMARDQAQYTILNRYMKDYPVGASQVLKAAYQALWARHQKGEDSLVEIVDLWTESLQENSAEFDNPDKLWGAASPEESLDMLGQTAIGPWQITTNIIQEYLGAPYGFKKEWKTREITAYCRKHHEVQAAMAADDIQRNYSTYGGKRAPYALQYYFWLEAFVKGEIGQGDWDTPVLVLPDPETGKVDESPQAKRNTGFYGKQILLGWKSQPHGILYWLWSVGDTEGIKAALRLWRDQVPWEWHEKERKFAPIPGMKAGRFAIQPADIKYCECHPEYRKALTRLVLEVSKESAK